LAELRAASRRSCAGVIMKKSPSCAVATILVIGPLLLACDRGNSLVVEPDTETLCNDGASDDSDGLVDCADPDCDGRDGGAGSGAQACQFIRETSCNDAFDNDRDLMTDCADDDCEGVGTCTAGEDCDNGIDDGDADLLADCADPECDGQD